MVCRGCDPGKVETPVSDQIRRVLQKWQAFVTLVIF